MRVSNIRRQYANGDYWVTQVTPMYGVVFIAIVVALAIEIYINSDPDRLDWLDWWFWARQNLSQLTESGQLTGIVMSPVQGLFGQSFPVSPFFHPLWALAASIDDPVQAHRISTAVVFVLYFCNDMVCCNTIYSKQNLCPGNDACLSKSIL